MPLAAGTKLGPYEIIAPLGAGGMGEVYRARDSRLKREVALKVLPERMQNDGLALERFRREAQLLAGMNHPHIAAVYGFEDGALAMELVEGETLADRLRRGALPMEEALTIARQLAEALEYAHERGIIHRDLKPANIKLTPDDKVKVLDFGLAKALSAELSGAELEDAPTLTTPATLAGTILGTAAYMAPEQARGKAVDRRADIWAFGVVWYEMLTGARAFAGETTSDVLAGVIRAEPEWTRLPDGLPEGQRRLLQRCLQKDPYRRQQSIGDVRRELEEPVEAATPVAAAHKGRRAPWWIAAVSIGVVIGVIGGGSGLWLLRTAPAAGTDYHFALDLPAGVTPSYGMAVSPDGSRVVFAASQNGKAMLWMRNLNAETATPLPGTDDGEMPFWSPDGKSIAFFADAALKRLDLDGGPARTLTAVAAGGARGGSWSPEGVIVYSPDILQPLQRIPAAGGTPGAATTLVAQRGDAGHRWPCFLPDGDHFVYSAESVSVGATTIAVGSLATGKSQPLFTLSQQDSQVLCASGHLLYSLDGALVAQGFDAAHLRTTGAPQVLATHVSPEGFAGPTGYLPVSVSPAGVLAFRRGTLAASQLEIVDRAGKVLHTVGAPGEFTEAQLSPDGKRIALGLPDATAGNSSLWLIDAAGGSRTRFTFDNKNHIGPIWSPDGRWIYYEANGTGDYEMYRKLADGSGEPQHIFKGGGYLTAESISHDGRIVTYSDTGSTTSTDLWWMTVNPGAQPQPGAAVVYLNTPAREIYSALSPDGKLMAYQSNANGGGDWEVFVGDFPRHSSQWQVSSGGGYWPKWSADGRELYFYAGGNLMVSAVSPGPTPQFGPPHALFALHPPESLTESSPDYTPLPDGKGFMIDQLLGGDSQAPIEIMTRWVTSIQH